MLELDKDNVKALFRSGKVMIRKGESASAVQHLRRAQELSPNEKVIIIIILLMVKLFVQVIKSMLRDAVKLHEANKKKEKDLYKKMVQGLQNEPKSEGKNHFSQPHRWVGNLLNLTSFKLAPSIVGHICCGRCCCSRNWDGHFLFLSKSQTVTAFKFV